MSKSLFNKIAGPRPATTLKKRLFPVNFMKLLKTPPVDVSVFRKFPCPLQNLPVQLIKIVIFKISVKYFQLIKSRNYQESFSQPNTFFPTSCKCFCAHFVHMIKIKTSLNPSRPNPGRREKIKSNFYFHTSLWCLKRFYEGL